MFKTIPQYISAISDTFGLTKTLGVIDFYTKPDGGIWFIVGNNSVIFRIRHKGECKMLKCYTRGKQNMRRIYGSQCLREELFVHSDYLHGEWVDVVLCDWIEGKNLHQVILDNLGNPSVMQDLADKFDKMALKLLSEEWAHGDLKPENIIVSPDGELHLIDFDAMFRPEFNGEQSDEIGTAAFQHPSRNSDFFDKSIDDFPIALISTALHALALDPTLAERYDVTDMLLMHPKEIVSHKSKALNEIIPLFAERGKAVSYRIAKLLDWGVPRIFSLPRLLEYATRPVVTMSMNENEAPLLDNYKGFWGYRREEEFVIAPVYDCGFDFREGLAAVRIGTKCHYINQQGVIVISCPQYDSAKSFRGGRAIVVKDGIRKQIDKNGVEIEAEKL